MRQPPTGGTRSKSFGPVTIANELQLRGTATVNRRRILCFAAITTLDASLPAWPQTSTRTARIGYLAAGGDAEVQFLQALREGLREARWVEGSNLVIEVRLAQGDYGRLRDLARGLVQQRVDLIFTSGTPSATAAKEATSEIPVVIGRVADPVGSGLVPAWRALGATSPGGLTWVWICASSTSTSSRRPYRTRCASACSGTRQTRCTRRR